MHPAIRLIARLWAGLAVVMLLAILAACGGGGSSCDSATGAPSQRTLSLQAPVGVLGSAAINPGTTAAVSVSATVSLGGTGTHAVALSLTTTAPGQPAQALGQPVLLLAGQSLRVTLAGQVPPGAQTLALAFAAVGTGAEGQSLQAGELSFQACDAAP